MNELEMLLTILNETLGEVDERMRAAQKAIDEHQAEIQKGQEDLEDAESRKKDAADRDEQATQRVSALGAYLRPLENQPAILMAKMQALVNERMAAASALREAEGRMESIRQDLNRRRQVLAAGKDALDRLRKERNTLSGLIAKARANG